MRETITAPQAKQQPNPAWTEVSLSIPIPKPPSFLITIFRQFTSLFSLQTWLEMWFRVASRVKDVRHGLVQTISSCRNSLSPWSWNVSIPTQWNRMNVTRYLYPPYPSLNWPNALPSPRNLPLKWNSTSMTNTLQNRCLHPTQTWLHQKHQILDVQLNRLSQVTGISPLSMGWILVAFTAYLMGRGHGSQNIQKRGGKRGLSRRRSLNNASSPAMGGAGGGVNTPNHRKSTNKPPAIKSSLKHGNATTNSPPASTDNPTTERKRTKAMRRRSLGALPMRNVGGTTDDADKKSVVILDRPNRPRANSAGAPEGMSPNRNRIDSHDISTSPRAHAGSPQDDAGEHDMLRNSATNSSSSSLFSSTLKHPGPPPAPTDGRAPYYRQIKDADLASDLLQAQSCDVGGIKDDTTKNKRNNSTVLAASDGAESATSSHGNAKSKKKQQQENNHKKTKVEPRRLVGPKVTSIKFLVSTPPQKSFTVFAPTTYRSIQRLLEIHLQNLTCTIHTPLNQPGNVNSDSNDEDGNPLQDDTEDGDVDDDADQDGDGAASSGNGQNDQGGSEGKGNTASERAGGGLMKRGSILGVVPAPGGGASSNDTPDKDGKSKKKDKNKDASGKKNNEDSKRKKLKNKAKANMRGGRNNNDNNGKNSKDEEQFVPGPPIPLSRITNVNALHPTTGGVLRVTVRVPRHPKTDLGGSLAKAALPGGGTSGGMNLRDLRRQAQPFTPMDKSTSTQGNAMEDGGGELAEGVEPPYDVLPVGGGNVHATAASGKKERASRALIANESGFEVPTLMEGDVNTMVAVHGFTPPTVVSGDGGAGEGSVEVVGETSKGAGTGAGGSGTANGTSGGGSGEDNSSSHNQGGGVDDGMDVTHEYTFQSARDAAMFQKLISDLNLVGRPLRNMYLSLEMLRKWRWLAGLEGVHLRSDGGGGFVAEEKNEEDDQGGEEGGGSGKGGSEDADDHDGKIRANESSSSLAGPLNSHHQSPSSLESSSTDPMLLLKTLQQRHQNLTNPNAPWGVALDDVYRCLHELPFLSPMIQAYYDAHYPPWRTDFDMDVGFLYDRQAEKAAAALGDSLSTGDALEARRAAVAAKGMKSVLAAVSTNTSSGSNSSTQRRNVIGFVDFLALFAGDATSSSNAKPYVTPDGRTANVETHRQRAKQAVLLRKRVARASLYVRSYVRAMHVVVAGWRHDARLNHVHNPSILSHGLGTENGTGVAGPSVLSLDGSVASPAPPNATAPNTTTSHDNNLPLPRLHYRLSYDDDLANIAYDKRHRNEYYEATVGRDVLCELHSDGAETKHRPNTAANAQTPKSPQTRQKPTSTPQLMTSISSSKCKIQGYALVGCHVFAMPDKKRNTSSSNTSGDAQHTPWTFRSTETMPSSMGAHHTDSLSGQQSTPTLAADQDPVMSIDSLYQLIASHPQHEFFVMSFFPEQKKVAVVLVFVRTLPRGVDLQFDSMLDELAREPTTNATTTSLQREALSIFVQLGPRSDLSPLAWAALKTIHALLSWTKKKTGKEKDDTPQIASGGVNERTCFPGMTLGNYTTTRYFGGYSSASTTTNETNKIPNSGQPQNYISITSHIDALSLRNYPIKLLYNRLEDGALDSSVVDFTFVLDGNHESQTQALHDKKRNHGSGGGGRAVATVRMCHLDALAVALQPPSPPKLEWLEATKQKNQKTVMLVKSTNSSQSKHVVSVGNKQKTEHEVEEEKKEDTDGFHAQSLSSHRLASNGLQINGQESSPWKTQPSHESRESYSTARSPLTDGGGVKTIESNGTPKREEDPENTIENKVFVTSLRSLNMGSTRSLADHPRPADVVRIAAALRDAEARNMRTQNGSLLSSSSSLLQASRFDSLRSFGLPPSKTNTSASPRLVENRAQEKSKSTADGASDAGRSNAVPVDGKTSESKSPSLTSTPEKKEESKKAATTNENLKDVFTWMGLTGSQQNDSAKTPQEQIQTRDGDLSSGDVVGGGNDCSDTAEKEEKVQWEFLNVLTREALTEQIEAQTAKATKLLEKETSAKAQESITEQMMSYHEFELEALVDILTGITVPVRRENVLGSHCGVECKDSSSTSESKEADKDPSGMINVPVLHNLTAHDLFRFLIASQFELKVTAVRLVESAAWRGITFPIDTRLCQVELHTGQFFQQGKDRIGRPVFYFRRMCLGPWRKDVDASVLSYLHRLENSLARLSSKNPAVRIMLVLVVGAPVDDANVSKQKKKEPKKEETGQKGNDDGEEGSGTSLDSEAEMSPSVGTITGEGGETSTRNKGDETSMINGNPRVDATEEYHLHVNEELERRFLSLLLRHYPGRLYKVLIVPDGKSLFKQTGSRLRKQLSDPKARAKVVSLESVHALKRYIDESEIVTFLGGKAPVNLSAYTS